MLFYHPIIPPSKAIAPLERYEAELPLSNDCQPLDLSRALRSFGHKGCNEIFNVPLTPLSFTIRLPLNPKYPQKPSRQTLLIYRITVKHYSNRSRLQRSGSASCLLVPRMPDISRTGRMFYEHTCIQTSLSGYTGSNHARNISTHTPSLPIRADGALLVSTNQHHMPMLGMYPTCGNDFPTFLRHGSADL